ncbi:MAG TPA: nucleotide pyrophosphatase/phosphodiesterase family protein [Polyangia bacterium]|nr:nucleotide pyrophosphatase/phosphodiesterase family protein [Polyangia bacterium]
MRRTLVLDVVGLTPKLVGEHTPHLAALARAGALRPLRTIEPAVTCAVQSTFTTGLLPREHGCVANGWYYRDTAEVALWRQSNALVTGEKIWDAAKRRDPAFTCAKLFWWFNMYSTADFAVTPRPQYPADGRKVPDVHTHPAALRDELQRELGTFPLFRFWGPAADITCSDWIGKCAARVWERQKPTLSLVYLPHLDYNLQRLGPSHPDIPKDLRAIDAVCGALIAQAERDGAAVVVLSEYGITEVGGAVPLNQVLRRAGLLAARREDAGEILDAGASEAFAVVDHQLAHVYVKRRERIEEVAQLLREQAGVEAVWGEADKRAHGLDHARSGELVAVSTRDRWFSYPYWLDDALAPDFARTVDIHRKPGYDPVELFLDPALALPKLKIAAKLLRRKLGFRALLDVIPLDTSLVKGSHGRLPETAAEGPLFITNDPANLPPGDAVDARQVKDAVLSHVFSS